MVTWKRTGTSQCLRFTQTQEAVSIWPSNCQLLCSPISTHVELHRQAHLPVDAGGLSTQPRPRGCLRTHPALETRRLRLTPYTTNLQPRPCWLLHQYRHGPLCHQLASYITLSQLHHEYTCLTNCSRSNPLWATRKETSSKDEPVAL